MSIVVNETGAASIQCEVEGNSQPKVTWLRDNFSLLANKRVVSTAGGLVINDVTLTDDGTYTCEARNILGVMKSSVRLTAQGKK